ncbi:MAG: MMPL family transporter [Candidatus Symbiothrix sp.]|jgi:predicted RND superfamily exporter protein|nr:MMPL family transporter [Candidatus Symbiothrix sp.]
MNKIIIFIINKSVILFVCLVILTVIFAYGISMLETGNTQESELPEENELVKTKKNIEEIFGKKDIILIGIESDNIFTMQTLSKIKEIEESLKEIDGVIPDEIISIVSVNNIIGNSEGIEVGQYIQEIPTDVQKLDELRQLALSNQLMVDRIISKDARFSAIVANIEEGYSEEFIYEKVSEIVEKYSNPEHIFISGDPIQQKEIDMGIQGDMRFLIPIALLLLVLAYYYFFRTILGVLFPLAIVLLSIIWTMGVIPYLGYKITVVSSVIPILMVVISGSYAIHLMQKFYEEYKSKEDNIDDIRKKIIKSLIKPFLLTCLTSALGMITLVIFKVKSIKEFGIIISLGTVFTYLITIILTSSILYFIRNRKLKVSFVSKNRLLERFVLSMASLSLKNTKVILLLAVFILGISIFGIFNIKIGNDFIEYFPKNHRLSVAYEKFNNNLSGANYIEIMFDGKNADVVKSPDFLNKVDALLKYAKEKYSYVGNSFSVIDIVKRMNKELHNGDVLYEKIPDDQEAIAQYLLLYSMSGNPGDFNSIVDYDYQRTKVRMMLTSSEQDDHREIYNGLTEYAKEHFENTLKVEFGGEVIFWLAQIDYIVIGKIQNIICAIIIVFLICMLAFRSFKYGIVSIIPLTLSSLFTFGIMGFTGIRLETATAIITSIGIGIGIDFAIHYISALKRETAKGYSFSDAVNNTIQTTGKAITLDVVTTILGFLVFTFSGFIPIQHFGWLITLTMIGACISSLIMFPALIKLFNIKKYENI